MAAQINSSLSARPASRGLLLEDVVGTHGTLLQRDAARHTRCQADADAVFSEACFRFLSYFPGAAEGDHALRWLRTAVKHAAHRLYRIERRRELLHSNIAQTTGSRVSKAEEVENLEREYREFLRRLTTLKTDQRTALLLFAAGYSYAEIAERHGWTYTKVNRCIAEGRAALREIEGGEK